MNRLINMSLAILLDLIIGDPYSWPHPVKFMGSYINWFLNKINWQNRQNKEQYYLGTLLAVSLIVSTIFITIVIFYIASKISEYLSNVVEIYILYACLSAKTLVDESNKVYKKLQNGGLIAARQQVANIVGRETGDLSFVEIVQATIETVAENSSDGFIAPFIYGLFFGPLGALIYKAVNTLDSMVGYTYLPYTYIGRFSAKLDDVLNYIPARLTAILIIIVSKIMFSDNNNAYTIYKRDKNNHASPNAGHPEAAMAGALNIQLGGGHYYGGHWVDKPYIGSPNKEPSAHDIKRVNQILYGIVILTLSILALFIIGGKFSEW